ncbi:MAG: VWA domain-containing protein [Bacteroides sp.]
MFRFGEVEIIWLLLLVPVQWLLMFWARRRRRRRIARLGDAQHVRMLMPYASEWRFWFKGGLLSLAIAALVFALARPQFGLRQEKAKRTGAEVMFVLDVSRSMLAQDVRPSRLERAKLGIQQLLNRLHDDRIGLILFAGRAYVQLPITNDYSSAQMFLGQVNTDMISEQGTALGSALQLAIRSFSPQEGIGRAIVVISDGENHEDDPLSAAEEAAKQGIKIFTVGIGSLEGAPLPDASGGLKKDGTGNVVISRLDEKVLASIAATTGGVYMHATNFQSGLDPIYEGIDTMQKAEYEQVNYTSYDERFQLFLAIALGLLVLGTIVLERRNPWFNLGRIYRATGGRSAD